ncbi:cytochrome P450 2D10 [Elysia marginata]|uniref:Cytochrome P450 2D10 n=1 Tax=Elysia marginata TaxID=1093978 RepID=A0AAV4F288_9GAST|nr:cytochrome P450 2D10 [Elysia marginata]
MLSYLLSALTSSWSLIGSFLALLVFWAWSKTKLKYEGSNIPPFPAPAKPFLGHLLLMKGDIMENISWMRKKAGDIFSLNLAGQHLIVVHGIENMRQILVKHAEFASDRPVDMSSQVVGEENHGMLTSRGPNWKEQRSTSVNILRDFGMGKDMMAKKTESEVQIYIEKLASFQGQAIDLPLLTNAAVCNVVCSIIVGDRFDYDDKYFRRMMDNLNGFILKAPSPVVFYAATILKKLPGDLFSIKEWEASVNDLNENFCKYQINRNKKDLNLDNEPENFIIAYLQEMQKKKESNVPTHLDEPNLVSNIKSLFLAGTETTSTTINWCVLFCLHHPEVQEKVFNEINTHVGTARALNKSDIPNLHYLSAVIRETQRLSGVAPLLPRLVTENFEVQGYLIPKDSQLMLNLNSALQDEETWKDADKFYPERFLDENGHIIKRNEFIPFGLGRRICPGEALARVELALFLASMFQRFRFEPEDPSELPTLKGVIALTLTPKPYKVRFLERSI